MGLDGEWIRDDAKGPAGNEGTAEEPDDGWPDDGWPDGDWPDVTPPPGAGKGRGHGGVPGFPARAAALWVAVAMVAAAAGAAAALFLVKGTPASAVGEATPSASAPAGSGTGLPTLPGLSGNGNGQLQMMITGRVLAVSGRSITIGGDGPSVTAAVTRATKITGAVRGIGSVKVADQVSAQITGSSGHLTATAIQDPA